MDGNRDVRVVYRKYDGGLHWNLTMGWLGEDKYGRWAGLRAGGVTRQGNGPEVILAEPNVGLFPYEGGWTGWFQAAPARLDVYCDITTAPVWTARDEVTMIDLDLDVCRVRDTGEVLLLDEDEFAAHRIRYNYPDAVAAEAERTAAWLLGIVGDGAEPFRSTYLSWLALVS